MESFFSKYRNTTALGAVLLLQILGLAVQVKRPLDPANPDHGSIRLIRVWAMTIVTPFERAVVATGDGLRDLWHDYINVAGLRSENRDLRNQNEQLQIQMARMAEDANQAHRLQSVLGFKEQFVTQTMAAQVIGTSGSEQSRVLTIDKGSKDGVQPDMAVITPQGIAGKVRDVGRWSSQVLLINDSLSGVGAILSQSRLYGVVKGDSGRLFLDHVMSDEKVAAGEPVITSGGDGIFPKGLPIGTVSDVSPGPDLFLKISVKPAASLDRLDEILIITQVQSEVTPEDNATGRRAADILAQRLPGLKPKAPDAVPTGANAKPATTSATTVPANKPAPQATTVNKPAIQARTDAATPSSVAAANPLDAAKQLPVKPAPNQPAATPEATPTDAPPPQ